MAGYSYNPIQSHVLMSLAIIIVDVIKTQYNANRLNSPSFILSIERVDDLEAPTTLVTL